MPGKRSVMKVVAIIFGVLLLLGLAAGAKLVGIRNDLVAQQESIKGAWAQVDVVIERRADLIPNLVQTVKGFTTHEQSVIDSITAARAALGGARTPGGIVSVDRPAARERRVQEGLEAALEGGGGPRRGLLIPGVVELDEAAGERLCARAGELAELGLAVEPFGAGAVVVCGGWRGLGDPSAGCARGCCSTPSALISKS